MEGFYLSGGGSPDWTLGYPTYDARYVQKAGDTMTGALEIANVGAAPDLRIVRSSGGTAPELRMVNTNSITSVISFYETEDTDGGTFEYGLVSLVSMNKGLYGFVKDGGGKSQVLGFTKASRATAVGYNAGAFGVNSVGLGREAAATDNNCVVINAGTASTGSPAANTVTVGITGNRLIVVTATGLGISTDTPTAKLDINGDKIRIETAKTPSSAGDTGDTGDWCWDANYIYVCVATNTWKRVAIATW